MNLNIREILGFLIVAFLACIAIIGFIMSISDADLEASIKILDNETSLIILLNNSIPMSQKIDYINNNCNATGITKYGEIGVTRCKEHFMAKYLLP